MLAKDKDTITLTRGGWFKAATAARPALETPHYAAIGQLQSRICART